MHSGGATVAEIRAAIDRDYGARYTTRTPTALPTVE